MSKKWLYLPCAALVLSVGLTPAFADRDHDDDHGHGNGHANGHAKHESAVEQRVDRREDRRAPPPVGYMHTVIGGNIVLVNRKTFFVLDVFHFEM